MCGWCWEEVAGKAVAAVTGLVGLDVVTMVQQTPPVYMAAWAVLALYALSWLLQKLSSKPPMILTWPLLGGFLKFIEVSGFVRHVPQRVPTIRYHQPNEGCGSSRLRICGRRAFGGQQASEQLLNPTPHRMSWWIPAASLVGPSKHVQDDQGSAGVAAGTPLRLDTPRSFVTHAVSRASRGSTAATAAGGGGRQQRR